MTQAQKRLTYLLEVFGNHKSTENELAELFHLIENEGDQEIKQYLYQLLQSYNETEALPPVRWDKLFSEIQNEKNSREATQSPDQPTHTVKKHNFSLIRWSAAAILLIFLGVSAFYLLTNNRQPVSYVDQHQIKLADIVPPEVSRAILTTYGGNKILIDNIKAGQPISDGTMEIKKGKDGKLVIHGKSNTTTMHTLVNPKGSKVLALVLDDGTNVWLNAASSIRFPETFQGTTRQVLLEGEAYFEVTHNAHKPFVVKKGDMQVQVLGTHFNVSAYNDEPSIKVTLLEGLVNVKSGQSEQLIKPRQQALIDKNKNLPIRLNKGVDVDEVIAWQQDKFIFKNQDIHEIMRQVARWYNVDIKFKDEIHENFYAEVSRNTNITTLLKMLEATKAVHFKLTNKTIIVMKGAD